MSVAATFARDPISGSIAGTYSEGGDSLLYREYDPTGASTSESSFPLILFLHGAGERGSNNTSQVTSHIQGLIDHTESGPTAAYLLAPQCPAGLQWTNISFGTGSYSNPTLKSPDISTPLRLVLNLVQEFAATHNVDMNRIYITGLSMGGYGTLDAIARLPDFFAAAAPLSGGGNLAMADVYSSIPIWAFHGSADPTVPVGGSRNTITAIENIGGTDARYTELAGQGHVIWSPIYNGGSYGYDSNYTGSYAVDGTDNLYSWMFDQKLAAVPEPSAAGLIWIGIFAIGIRQMVSARYGKN